MGLIRFLIIAISVIYIIRTLARIFLPYLFKRAVHKMAQQQQANQQHNQGNKSKPEGTISVDFVPPNTPKKPKLDQAGDFVDYEELK
jgi:flagellar basal body-associated protein FliL